MSVGRKDEQLEQLILECPQPTLFKLFTLDSGSIGMLQFQLNHTLCYDTFVHRVAQHSVIGPFCLQMSPPPPFSLHRWNCMPVTLLTPNPSAFMATIQALALQTFAVDRATRSQPPTCNVCEVKLENPKPGRQKPKCWTILEPIRPNS